MDSYYSLTGLWPCFGTFAWSEGGRDIDQVSWNFHPIQLHLILRNTSFYTHHHQAWVLVGGPLRTDLPNIFWLQATHDHAGVTGNLNQMVPFLLLVIVIIHLTLILMTSIFMVTNTIITMIITRCQRWSSRATRDSPLAVTCWPTLGGGKWLWWNIWNILGLMHLPHHCYKIIYLSIFPKNGQPWGNARK